MRSGTLCDLCFEEKNMLGNNDTEKQREERKEQKK